MKNIYISLVVSLFFLVSACSERELGMYHGDTVYISFAKNSEQDSVIYSFRTYPEGEIVAEVPLKIQGAYLTEPRKFTVSAADSTTLSSAAYELPVTCEFAPGQESDTITIKFFNNLEELDTKTFRLFLQIDESNNVKRGDKPYAVAKFYVSDKLEQPIWWLRNDGTENNPYNIVDQIYLGDYSETKYLLFLEELEKDGVVFDGTDMNILKKYSLRVKYRLEEYEEENGEPMRDENNMIITVPVAG